MHVRKVSFFFPCPSLPCSLCAGRDGPKSKAAIEAERVRLELEQQQREEAERAAAEAILEAKRASEFDLATCAAQDYLARTVYPALAAALDQVDHVRPADPVEYLAVLLHKEAETSRKRIDQLNQIHTLREQLRAQFTKEYSVAGRV